LVTRPIFPAAEIEKRLRSWWQRKNQSPLRRTTQDPRKSGGNVFDILPEVSSTEAVEIFIEVEPLLGFKLKGSGGIIKPGGYRNCDEFVQHMLPRLQQRFNDNYPPAKKASA
jgi:hypothetical protein